MSTQSPQAPQAPEPPEPPRPQDAAPDRATPDRAAADRPAPGGPPTAGTAPANPHLVLALVAIVGTQLMLLLDATVVNVALPDIGLHLGFSATGLSWVLNVYTLAFGGLLLLGSRIGDLIGRRTALVWGIAAFTLASVAGGVAQNATTLLVARGAQGAAAALAAPSTLALIATNFREGPERHRALSVFSAVAGAAAALGLTAGGVLTDAGSWRWVFFINIPIGVVMVLMAPRVITETQKHRGGRFDVTGAVTGTLGMFALVYAFIRVAESSWGDARALTSFAVAAVLLTTFLVNEFRAERPLVVLRLFADRNRALAYAVLMLLPAAMFGVFYFSTQYMQNYLGYSPLKTGFAFLPMAGPLFVAARLVPKLLVRFGARRVAGAGALVTLVGAVWVTQLSASDGYAAGILPMLILMGFGIGLTMMPLNTTVLAGVAPQDAGSASGLLQTMQQVGGSLGLSALVTVFGTVSRHHREDSFIHGATAAFTLSAVFVGVSLLLVLSLRTPPPARKSA